MTAPLPPAAEPAIAGRRRGVPWPDIVMAVALAAIGALEVLRQIGIPQVEDPARLVIELAPVWVIVLSSLSLALRRYLPMTVLVITSIALLSSHAIDEAAAGWLSVLIASFSAGIQGPSRRAVIVGFALLTAINLTMWVTVFGRPQFDPVQPALVVAIAGIAWAGSVLRVRTRQATELREHAIRLELEREREAERAATAERTRIARELHDVIAHSLSVMVIQAAAARRVMDADPARAHQALDAVEETGRSAMIEMRRLLGVVRRDDAEVAAPRAPQPSLANVERLVDDMRDAGLHVELELEGDLGELPPGVDVSAYRIVQEALTNSLRHAPGAHARVRVSYGAREIELEVTDDGGAAPAARTPAPATPGGHGLVGMRERVALLRGQLEIGPRPEGGFRVFARLPRAGS